MSVIHCTVVLMVVHPMFTIRERTIQAVIGRGPVNCLSRKVTVPVEKLFLVLTESLVRLSEHLLPSISGMLAVFHEAVIPLHQPRSVVKNCKRIESVLLKRTRKRRERTHCWQDDPSSTLPPHRVGQTAYKEPRCSRHLASSDRRAYWLLFGPSAVQNASFRCDVAPFLAADPVTTNRW